MTQPVIKKISRGRTQNRVTVPRAWSSEYVRIEPLKFDSKKLRVK